MKSMSISVSGISRLYCVAKWQYGFCRSLSPVNHIFDGEKVWHHVMIPAQVGSAFAAMMVSVASSDVLTVVL